MYTEQQPSRDVDPFDETILYRHNGPELIVLAALRAWLRPQCSAVEGKLDWREALLGAGMGVDAMECFDTLLRSLLYVSPRPLDMRCRCCSALAKDEATILQAIGLLQRSRFDETIALLGEWLEVPALSGVTKTIWRFAEALGDVGLFIQVRERDVQYMQ
jgi:hypothetical protein